MASPYTNLPSSAPPSQPGGSDPAAGVPSPPEAHPGNSQAAVQGGDQQYVQTTPAKNPGRMGQLTDRMNRAGKQAEGFLDGLWGHLSTGPSVAQTAVGKLNTLRLSTPQSAEAFWRQTFAPPAGEMFRNYFVCHLSTSTGAVPGTLFVSSAAVNFISDRPLQFASGPGQVTSSFYKVNVPLIRLAAVNRTHNQFQAREKYIQLVTSDEHQFWFMGFLSFDKAMETLEAACRDARHAPPPAANAPSDGAASALPQTQPQTQPQPQSQLQSQSQTQPQPQLQSQPQPQTQA